MVSEEYEKRRAKVIVGVEAGKIKTSFPSDNQFSMYDSRKQLMKKAAQRIGRNLFEASKPIGVSSKRIGGIIKEQIREEARFQTVGRAELWAAKQKARRKFLLKKAARFR